MVYEMVIEMINEYKSIKIKMDKKFTESRDRLSVIQKEINDILHIIEYHKVKVTVMSKLTKQLRLLHAERRILKENVIIIENILKNGKNPDDEISNSQKRNARYEQEAAYCLNNFLTGVKL